MFQPAERSNEWILGPLCFAMPAPGATGSKAEFCPAPGDTTRWLGASLTMLPAWPGPNAQYQPFERKETIIGAALIDPMTRYSSASGVPQSIHATIMAGLGNVTPDDPDVGGCLPECGFSATKLWLTPR